MAAPLRASDQDRQEAVLALSDEYAAGRLDREEFDRRQARAQEAVYLHELDPLFADLPARVAPTARPALATLPAPTRIERRRWRLAAVLVALVAVSTAMLAFSALLAVGSAVAQLHLVWLVVPLLLILVVTRSRRRALAHAAMRRGGMPQGSPWGRPWSQDGADQPWEWHARWYADGGHGPRHGHH